MIYTQLELGLFTQSCHKYILCQALEQIRTLWYRPSSREKYYLVSWPYYHERYTHYGNCSQNFQQEGFKDDQPLRTIPTTNISE